MTTLQQTDQKQKIAGSDASINVDGMTLTRSTNLINDLFEGYEVNILNTTSSNAKLTSSVDTTEATSNLQSFVDAVNVIRSLLNEKTYRGSSSEEAGELSSDPIIKSLKQKIESFTSSALSGFGVMMFIYQILALEQIKMDLYH